MFKKLKIGTRIVLATFILVVFAVLSTSIIASKNFYDLLMQDAKNEAGLAVRNFDFMMREEMARGALLRDQLMENLVVTYALRTKSRQSIYAEADKILQASGFDAVTFVAADGEVVARTHNRENVGDNISDAPDFREAMAGRTYGWLMESPSLRFGYYFGGPVRIDNQIVGMVRVEKSLVEPGIVDRIKEMFGVETTIFAGKTRVNTTLMTDGKRMTGTDATPTVIDSVLEGGRELSARLDLFGKPYIAQYAPLRDDSDTVKGMLFVGNSLENIYPMIYKTMLAVALAALVTLLVAFAIAYAIGRMISRPLASIVRVAERGREGDLTIRLGDFGYNGGGELALLVDSIHDMIRAQAATLGQVVETTGAVRDNARSLSSLSEESDEAMGRTQRLIEHATDLCTANAASVARGSGAIEAMTEGVTTVAKMATDGANALSRTTERSRGVAAAVDRLASGMDEVDTKTMENQKKIGELVASIAEISNFIGTIEAIAEQTNLLALNAAIEAARAGEAGRGFAVVAEEVRKLADGSRSASKSVESLVSSLGQQAEEAIAASEGSARIVREIDLVAADALNDMNGAMAEIAALNEAIQSIAAAAEEQAASTAEIGAAIGEVNRSTDSIMQRMKELHGESDKTANIGHAVSDTAGEMTRSVEALNSVLAHFRID